MKTHYLLKTLLVVAFALTGSLCFADEATESNPKEVKALSWNALNDKAENLAANQHGTRDVAAQIRAKSKHMQRLRARRDQLLKQKETVARESYKTVQEIDRIPDAQLRDESLLRFKAGKDIRTGTIKETLAAVEDSIRNEEKELATLQRLYKARQAEARLHGVKTVQEGDYSKFLAGAAQKVRDTEYAAQASRRAECISALAKVILPRLEPRVPRIAEEVLRSGQAG